MHACMHGVHVELGWQLGSVVGVNYKMREGYSDDGCVGDLGPVRMRHPTADMTQTIAGEQIICLSISWLSCLINDITLQS